MSDDYPEDPEFDGDYSDDGNYPPKDGSYRDDDPYYSDDPRDDLSFASGDSRGPEPRDDENSPAEPVVVDEELNELQPPDVVQAAPVEAVDPTPGVDVAINPAPPLPKPVKKKATLAPSEQRAISDRLYSQYVWLQRARAQATDNPLEYLPTAPDPQLSASVKHGLSQSFSLPPPPPYAQGYDTLAATCPPRRRLKKSRNSTTAKRAELAAASQQRRFDALQSQVSALAGSIAAATSPAKSQKGRRPATSTSLRTGSATAAADLLASPLSPVAVGNGPPGGWTERAAAAALIASALGSPGAFAIPTSSWARKGQQSTSRASSAVLYSLSELSRAAVPPAHPESPRDDVGAPMEDLAVSGKGMFDRPGSASKVQVSAGLQTTNTFSLASNTLNARSPMHDDAAASADRPCERELRRQRSAQKAGRSIHSLSHVEQPVPVAPAPRRSRPRSEGPTVPGWLAALGLPPGVVAVIIKEEIDAEMFWKLSDREIDSLGLPIGPAKRLRTLIANGPPVQNVSPRNEHSLSRMVRPLDDGASAYGTPSSSVLSSIDKSLSAALRWESRLRRIDIESAGYGGSAIRAAYTGGGTTAASMVDAFAALADAAGAARAAKLQMQEREHEKEDRSDSPPAPPLTFKNLSFAFNRDESPHAPEDTRRVSPAGVHSEDRHSASTLAQQRVAVAKAQAERASEAANLLDERIRVSTMRRQSIRLGLNSVSGPSAPPVQPVEANPVQPERSASPDPSVDSSHKSWAPPKASSQPSSRATSTTAAQSVGKDDRSSSRNQSEGNSRDSTSKASTSGSTK